jgi:hypothetical protein
MPPLDAISAVIQEEIPDTHMQNVAAAEDAYREVQLLGLIESSPAPGPVTAGIPQGNET